MCTGFLFKGKDTIYAYNLDVDPSTWSFSIYKNKRYFALGLIIGSSTYFTHGVNNNAMFACLPYMNGESNILTKGIKRERIDLLVNKYIRSKYNYEEVLEIPKTKEIINLPNVNLHSLISDGNNALLVEPGIGTKEINNKYFVISNFPIQVKLEDYSNPFYGKDRYDLVNKELNTRDELSPCDALDILRKVKQDGKWATRISFVYSKLENKVYYCIDGNFENILIHQF